MKKVLFLILFAFAFHAEAQLYKSSEGSVSFFSKAPLEDIDATSKKIVSMINPSSNEIVFGVAIETFQFKIPKMQEDFNEDFMESTKYPDATYKGKINEKINWEKDGSYTITSKGVLTMSASLHVEDYQIGDFSIEMELDVEYSWSKADPDVGIPHGFPEIGEMTVMKMIVTGPNFVRDATDLERILVLAEYNRHFDRTHSEQERANELCMEDYHGD